MPDEAKQQIIKLLLEKDNFLVSTCEPDKIENIASVLALGLILKKLNKNFLLFVSEMPEMKLDFLPEAESLSSELLSKNLVVFIKEERGKLKKISYDRDSRGVRLELVPAEGAFTPQDISFAFKEQKIDYLIFLASPRFCAIKELEKFKGNKPIINIDFHKENDLYGDFNWSVQQAVSIAEVLLGLTEALEGVKGEKLHGADLATLLYTCLFWATNGLRGEVPSRAFSVAAQLISWGADKKRVEEAFEKRWPIDFFMFLAQIWQNAEIQNQKLISHIDFKQGQREKWERLQKHIAREIKNRSPNIDSLFLLYSNNQATKLYAYVDDESQISNIPVTEWLFKKPPVFSGVLKMPIDKAKEKLKEILF